MLSELELLMYNSQKHIVEVNVDDGEVVEGECIEFTNSLDNEPEVSSITIKTQKGLIEIYENEITSIKHKD